MKRNKDHCTAINEISERKNLALGKKNWTLCSTREVLSASSEDELEAM